MTGAKWADRYGMVSGEAGGRSKFTNVESALTYKKLQRTGRLLRGIRVKPFGSYSGAGMRIGVEMSNATPYASSHELGTPDAPKRVSGKDVAPGVKSVYFGGEVHQRRHMAPSMQVLGVPHKLLGAKMRSFGW